jgi:hypothetical protein
MGLVEGIQNKQGITLNLKRLNSLFFQTERFTIYGI